MKRSPFGSQRPNHSRMGQRPAQQSRSRSSSNTINKSGRQRPGNGGRQSDSMTSHLMRFHDSKMASKQFSAIKPTFLQNETSQHSKVNSRFTSNQFGGAHPHLASNVTQGRSTRPMGQSKGQSPAHFHNMLESNDPGQYSNGGVLNNLMQIASKQGTSQQGPQGSRFGNSQNPGDSKLDQRVHIFMNSNVSKGQQKSAHSNMPLSRIKMNFNPIQEDQFGEMSSSNNASRQRGRAGVTTASQNRSGMARPNQINSNFSEHPGQSAMSRAQNSKHPGTSNAKSK